MTQHYVNEVQARVQSKYWYRSVYYSYSEVGYGATNSNECNNYAPCLQQRRLIGTSYISICLVHWYRRYSGRYSCIKTHFAGTRDDYHARESFPYSKSRFWAAITNDVREAIVVVGMSAPNVRVIINT